MDITARLLNKWKRHLRVKGDTAFPGHGRLTAEEEKVRQLERGLAYVRQERGVLKKAVAIFSNPKS